MRHKSVLFILLFFCWILTGAQISDFNHIDFGNADRIAKLNKGASLKNLPVLAYKLTSSLPTDVEKFRAIHTWVCQNIEGDPRQHDLVTRKREQLGYESPEYLNWNSSFKKKAFKKLLNHKKTMCTGYAYIIKELCYLANIPCEVINGYARNAETNSTSFESVNHSWNAVKLKNKWYLCDATWSSGYIYGGFFKPNYNEGYFLADPRIYAKSHYPEEKKWFLIDTLISKPYKLTPLVYEDTFKHNVLPISPDEMFFRVEKNATVEFSFASEELQAKENIKLVERGYKGFNSLKIHDIITENGITSFKHTFKNRGVHDVHLSIGNDIVASYSVRVIK